MCVAIGTEVPWLLGVALAAAVLTARREAAWRVTAIVAIAHVAWVAGLGVFPIPLDAPAGDPGWRESVNLVPLRTITAGIDAGPGSPAFLQALQNTFILLPAGIYIPILAGGRRTIRTNAGTALAAGAALELTQAALSLAIGHPYRRLDVDDVILNTTGVAAGLAILAAAGWTRTGRALERARPEEAAEKGTATG
jgi:glycopeptide antibiotics resistance protein